MRRGALILPLILLAGCGGTARTASAPAPTPAAAPAHGRELVYLSRNTWDAVPEDVAVYADGTLDYRMLLHTKVNMHTRTTTLSPAALRDLRRVLQHTELAGANRVGLQQPRGHFSYLLRIDGRTITTADGHLTPGVKPLIRRLGRWADRMLLRGD